MTDILKVKVGNSWRGISVVQGGDSILTQADWSENDNTKVDYIKNKPTKLSAFTDDLGTAPTHTHSQYLTSHQDITGKADIDLGNVDDFGTSLCASWPMPSNTYENLTLGASGATYNAPANGYFVFDKQASDQQFIFIGSSSGVSFTLSASGTQGLCATIPVKENDTVTVSYNASGNTNNFKFVYAVGSESEAE